MPKKSHKKLLHKGKKSGKKSQRGGANRSNSKQSLSVMKGGRKVLEYKVINESLADTFASFVNHSLRTGWELQGNISFFRDKYVQTMTREKEIYQVEKVEPISEMVYKTKLARSAGHDISVTINKGDTRKEGDIRENIFPGLDIKITLGANTYLPKIKEISQGQDSITIIINASDYTREDLPDKSDVTFTIPEFQKITLSEEVKDVKIGTKINIEYYNVESRQTIKAINNVNRREIVFDTLLVRSS